MQKIMAEINKRIKTCDDNLKSTRCFFNYELGLSYITQETYNFAIKQLSELRLLKEIDGREHYVIKNLFKHQYSNFYKIQEYNRSKPRVIAQRFIGQKRVRDFIFNRDKVCLRCGASKKLTIDHIIPIHFDGLNEIDNLQTLCRSCNSWKSTKTIDFR
tara:strand:- start:159 stop:632 length:474 start_codon:yes stop_codon:yes gene_type:complete